MAQPNVVREPSMDEILASIRRIIESNDPVPQPGLATGRAEPEGFFGSAANDDSEDVPLTVDEIFAQQEAMALDAQAHDMREPDAAPVEALREPEQNAAQPQKSLSLADVAARVRAASERNPGLRDLAPKAAEPAGEATSPVATRSMTLTGEASAPAAPVTETGSEAIWAARVDEVQAEIADEPAAEPVTASDGPVPSLISAGTGQQVARSFQDLATAFEQAERRSFDEIAEELLRPMLQEWLDDNLPTLVERLVREEIERVARGPRR